MNDSTKQLSKCNMRDSDKDRLIRWEQNRRDLLGNANTLLFAVAGASLAFCASLIADEDICFGCWRSVFFIFSVALFALSLAANLKAALTRLEDARYTVKIIRAEEKQPDEVKKWKHESERLGEQTWTLLRQQVYLFAWGFLCLVVLLVLVYGNKLSP